MSHFFVLLTALSLRCPPVETFRSIDWKPQFTEAADIQIQQPAVALLTHASHKFDPLGETKEAVGRTVAAMKSAGWPVFYLHDRYNENNPAWMYLYDDWTPTAFIPSDIGHIKFDLGAARHVVCLGGYFGQCERATVTDTIRNWYTLADSDELRLTQITDATFTVAQHVNWEDPYREAVRSLLSSFKPQHRNAVISVSQILDHIATPEQQMEFLQRQVPAVPSDVNIVMDVLGHVMVLQAVSADSRTLVLAYRRSSDFLDATVPVIDFEMPIRWARRPGQPASFSVSDRGLRAVVEKSPTATGDERPAAVKASL